MDVGQKEAEDGTMPSFLPFLNFRVVGIAWRKDKTSGGAWCLGKEGQGWSDNPEAVIRLEERGGGGRQEQVNATPRVETSAVERRLGEGGREGG